jgi:ABC-type uncharacterized transport system substrate-binding protein
MLTHKSYFTKVPENGKKITCAYGNFQEKKLVVVSESDGRLAQHFSSFK